MYQPLFEGKEEVELKLFHLNQPEIVYNIFMESEPHLEVFPDYFCELGETVTTKICLKNPTKTNTVVYASHLPPELHLSLKNIELPAKKSVTIDVTFKQVKLIEEYKHKLILNSSIGAFNFLLSYVVSPSKVMNSIDIHAIEGENTTASTIVFKNEFDSQYKCRAEANI